MIAIYSTSDAVLKTMAENDADGVGDLAIGVGSVAELADAFKRLIDGNTLTTKMVFYTHGSAGNAYFGSQNFSYFVGMDMLRPLGVERVFTAGAEIKFLGCEIAAEPDGELFIAEAGRLFLRDGGGTLSGYTSPGYSNWATVKVGWNIFHLSGVKVINHVGTGGGVRLENHTYLDANVLRHDIARIGSGLKPLSPLGSFWFPNASVPDNVRPQIEDRLKEASKWLGDESRTPPFFPDLYKAAQNVIAAAQLYAPYDIADDSTPDV